MKSQKYLLNKSNKWIVEIGCDYKELSKKIKLPVCFMDELDFFSYCYIAHKNDQVLLIFSLPPDEFIDDIIIKNVCDVCAFHIANLISFNIDIPVTIGKVYPANRMRINRLIINSSDITNLIKSVPPTGRFSNILEAYREIKNEKNKSLKFLMYYRLLECFSADNSKKIDDFIKEKKIKLPFIKNKRNRKNMKSLITHIRDKIHPTKKTYRFPYFALEGNLPMIEKITREIILEILNS